MSNHSGPVALSQPLPRGSVDGQAHVFGGPYPLSPTRRYEPPENSTLDDMLAMHAALGIERGIIVQASAQGWETRYVIDVLKRVPHYRGVILMHDGITDRQLHDMHDAGVRGARFVFLEGFDISTDPTTIDRSIARVTELGWFAKFFVKGNDWIKLQDILRRIKIPVAIDHMGWPDLAGGVDQPVMKIILDFLRRDNWWMMLSNGDRISTKPNWDDIVPFAQAYINTAPDRVVWGSDWPHVANDGSHTSGPSDQIELLYRYAPDRKQLEAIMATNPKRLFQFAD